MTEDKKDKNIKIYTKDNFTFAGKLLHLDADFLQMIDFKTNKEMTFPILNIARIEEIKEVEK